MKSKYLLLLISMLGFALASGAISEQNKSSPECYVITLADAGADVTTGDILIEDIRTAADNAARKTDEYFVVSISELTTIALEQGGSYQGTNVLISNLLILSPTTKLHDAIEYPLKTYTNMCNSITTVRPSCGTNTKNLLNYTLLGYSMWDTKISR